MNKQFILIPSLFVLGIAAGIALMYRIGDDRSTQAVVEDWRAPTQADETRDHPMAKAFIVSQVSDNERIQLLEKQVESLSARIEQLEREVVAAEEQEIKETGALAINPATTIDTPVSRASPALTIENLVSAGIDEMLAADIIRRKNEIDLKTLELRDRSAREGYLGTGRYTDELNALRESDVALRDEIGDDAYNRYLFSSGQSNRVNIASVMFGSPAEQAGMQKGDVILNYGERQMFSWNELQNATTRGERGEYVNVTVLRNGQRINLWLPRGPLGVRLGSIRLKP